MTLYRFRLMFVGEYRSAFEVNRHILALYKFVY